MIKIPIEFHITKTVSDKDLYNKIIIIKRERFFYFLKRFTNGFVSLYI